MFLKKKNEYIIPIAHVIIPNHCGGCVRRREGVCKEGGRGCKEEGGVCKEGGRVCKEEGGCVRRRENM